MGYLKLEMAGVWVSERIFGSFREVLSLFTTFASGQSLIGLTSSPNNFPSDILMSQDVSMTLNKHPWEENNSCFPFRY